MCYPALLRHRDAARTCHRSRSSRNASGAPTPGGAQPARPARAPSHCARARNADTGRGAGRACRWVTARRARGRHRIAPPGGVVSGQAAPPSLWPGGLPRPQRDSGAGPTHLTRVARYRCRGGLSSGCPRPRMAVAATLEAVACAGCAREPSPWLVYTLRTSIPTNLLLQYLW